jgi:hypothetical protein
MKSYEEIKVWLNDTANKQKIVLGVCFILVFFVGFGAGGYEREIRRDSYKPLANYTTPPVKQPLTEGNNQGQVLGEGTTASSTAASANCVVKGNISTTTGKKIYHVQGGAFYAKVKPEECFKTEAEALAAGFVKSSR